MSLPETCTSICSATTGTIQCRSLFGPPLGLARTGPARKQMGTMAPIRPAVQRLRRSSLTAGRPLGGLLEVLELACRPGGVRLAAGVPGARPGRPFFHHRGRHALPPCLCLPRAWVPASGRIQLFHRTWHGPRHSLTGQPACWRRRRRQPDVSVKGGATAPTRRAGSQRIVPHPRWHPPRPHPARREGSKMHGFIKRAAVAPGYGPVASDVR